MIPIRYTIGDATAPTGGGIKIIAHICNDYGGWGAGFVTALSAKSPLPEQYYRRWNQEDERLPRCFIENPFMLGSIQFAPFGVDTVVCNMIAQMGNASQWHDGRAVRYGALENCLWKLANRCLSVPSPSVHMPRIGCGLGGGEWEPVSRCIMRTLCAYNIPTMVYDLS